MHELRIRVSAEGRLTWEGKELMEAAGDTEGGEDTAAGPGWLDVGGLRAEACQGKLLGACV
jgi:hypothetical protein